MAIATAESPLWPTRGRHARAPTLREPPAAIDRAAEVSLRFASGLLAHVSVAVTQRARPTLAIVGTASKVEAQGTLGPRGGGAMVHRAAEARGARGARGARELAFAAEDAYLRQLGAFGARCAGHGPRVDPDAVRNVALLHRISMSFSESPRPSSPTACSGDGLRAWVGWVSPSRILD